VNWQPPQPGEPPAGSIRNVLIRNVIAHGKGSCFINGHPDNWLEGVSLENVKLFLSTDPASPYDKSVHAMNFRWAKDLKLKDVQVIWDQPASEKWESALYLEDVKGLVLDGFTGRQAKPETDMPAVVLKQVEDAMIRNARAQQGTSVFLRVTGEKSRGICLSGNDFRRARIPYRLDSNVRREEIKELNNFPPAK
jgi:hypothetical protein